MNDAPPDALIAAAVARRDAALTEAKKWDDWIRAAQELAQAVNQTAGAPLAHTKKHVALPLGSPLTSREAADAVGERVLATEAVAKEIISALGRPVPTREMLAEMEQRGFVVGGKEPMATLMTRLIRAPSLENYRPYGWRLKEPRQDIGAAGSTFAGDEPAGSDPETTSGPVDPAAGGGT